MEPLRAGNERVKLIVVEDDPVARSMIANYFTKEGFQVKEAETLQACRQLLKQQPADILFIDIHLPDGSGLVFAQELRQISRAGIIFVTQRDSETDRVVGLEMAGDDYVVKPVNLRELLARTRSLLRRRQFEEQAPRRNPVILFGQWLMDLTRREVAAQQGEPIRLTRAEFDLLAALVEADGRPLSRDYLIEVISNRDVTGDLRTVDSLIARLRRKLVAAPDTAVPDPVVVIQTVPGIGYKLGIATQRVG